VYNLSIRIPSRTRERYRQSRDTNILREQRAAPPRRATLSLMTMTRFSLISRLLFSFFSHNDRSGDRAELETQDPLRSDQDLTRARTMRGGRWRVAAKTLGKKSWMFPTFSYFSGTLW